MKTISRIAILIAIFSIPCLQVFSQSNDRIDELLRQGQARLDATAYIVLAAGGDIAETDTVEMAFSKARELGLTLPADAPESPVRVDALSFMLMKSLRLKGGVMYRLFPGRRYAYRELVFSKVVNDKGGPARVISGDEVIRSLGYALELKGGK